MTAKLRSDSGIAKEKVFMNTIVLKGDICHTSDKDCLKTYRDSYLVYEGGICRGIFKNLPERYANIPVEDFTGKLILPGMVDLHIHAPQFAFRGTGMDYELLTWLKLRTFPEEAKYADLEYASVAYGMFSEKLRNSATTHAVILLKMTTSFIRFKEKRYLQSYPGGY
jgi:guanine deaminase